VSAAAQLACIGQPLSWLTLERHALDELPAPAAAAASVHLAACAACSSALAGIVGDRRALPPLPGGEVTPIGVQPRQRRRTWAIGAGIFVAAAAALLLVVLRPKDTGGELRASVRVKGAGLVHMSLVRERDGAVTFDPADVRDTDRWKVQLTCAPGGAATVEVLVHQSGSPPAVALPAQPFACGNAVVLPGAFRVTSGAATICARIDGAEACRRVAPP